MTVQLAEWERRLTGPIPQSLWELKEAVGVLFHCMTGPPMAYFEIPLADVGGRFTQYVGEEPHDEVERLVYVTVGWKTKAEERGQEAHQRLINRMWQVLSVARLGLANRGTPMIFWRRPLEFDEDLVDGQRVIKLTCRLIIPGYDLTPFCKHEGEPYPWVEETLLPPG